jgi:hypothetical protein
MRSTGEKIRNVLALIIVFGLVFTTNRLDRRHFEQAQESLSTIYYDRVLAQDYLFDLSNVFHNRRLRIADGELVSFENDREIESLLVKYEQTTLTRKEETLFLRLKENLNDLKGLGYAGDGNSARTYLDRIDSNLAELSDIQVRESKSHKVRGQESLESNQLISNMELILILFIGVVLQFALFYGGKKKQAG